MPPDPRYQVVRHNYRFAPYINTLARGAQVATSIAGAVPGARELARGAKRTYRSIRDLVEAKRARLNIHQDRPRFVQRLGPPQRVPNPELGPPRPPAMPPRLAVGGPAGGVKFSKEEHVVGKKRRRTYAKLSDILAQMYRCRYRWQLCSNTLTGPGRIPIGYGGWTGTDLVHHSLPIHFMSLSQNPQIRLDNVNSNKGSYRHGLYRVIRNAGTGELGALFFQSNSSDGVNSYDTNGHWQPEMPLVDSNPHTYFHKWSEVKMNLYGAKHIPITYTISLVKCPKEYDPLQVQPSPPVDPVTAPVTNHNQFNEFSRWVEDVIRTLVCNPLNEPGTKKEYKDNIKVVRQFSTTIQPMSYTNAAAEGDAPVKVGNVREFKMFVRHDRWRDYIWAEQDENVVQDLSWQDLGWDRYQQPMDNYTDEKWGQRMYMFITCTTGAITDLVANDCRSNRPVQLADIPNDFGSYDLIVRNEFYTGKEAA